MCCNYVLDSCHLSVVFSCFCFLFFSAGVSAVDAILRDRGLGMEDQEDRSKRMAQVTRRNKSKKCRKCDMLLEGVVGEGEGVESQVKIEDMMGLRTCQGRKQSNQCLQNVCFGRWYRLITEEDIQSSNGLMQKERLCCRNLIWSCTATHAR